MISLDKKELSPSGEAQISDETVQQIYNVAAILLFENNRSRQFIKDELIIWGLDEEEASIVIDNLIQMHRKQAGKSMLYGGLWWIGGIAATVASIGHIFWGAVIFGTIQFIKGIYQYFKY